MCVDGYRSSNAGGAGNLQQRSAFSLLPLASKRILFSPLTDAEAEVVESFMPAGPQMKCTMRQIVNSLLAVSLGAAWNHVSHGSASRMRLQRGVHRGDFENLYRHVLTRPDVFSAERIESFRRVAAMETAVANRRG